MFQELEKLLELVKEHVTFIDNEFSKPRSRYKTLFKILLALIILNIFYRIPSLPDKIRLTLAPTVRSISRITSLNAKTVRKYIAILKKKDLIMTASYLKHSGYVYLIRDITVYNVNLKFQDLPVFLMGLADMILTLGRIIERDYELRYRLIRFWKKILMTLYETLSEVRTLLGIDGRRKLKKLGLDMYNIILKLNIYIYSLESGNLDYNVIVKDITSLSKHIQELWSGALPKPILVTH